MSRFAPIVAAVGSVAALLATYVALGGTSYEPTPVADPCETRAWRDPGDVEAALEQIALSAVDGAACELGVSREELVLALRSDDSLDAFVAEHDISREDAERALSEGFVRSVDDAVVAGALPESVAGLVRDAAESIPPRLLLELLDRLRGLLS